LRVTRDQSETEASPTETHVQVSAAEFMAV